MADLTALETALSGYVTQITNPLLLAKANLTLSQYIDAEKAFSNINASAASSYSDARGTINKRAAELARTQADSLYDELMQLCEMGGVSIPHTEAAAAYWDLSGFGGSV